MLAFELSFRYRNPVIVLADGYLGQMAGRVALPGGLVQPGCPNGARPATTGASAQCRHVDLP